MAEKKAVNGQSHANFRGQSKFGIVSVALHEKQ